MRQQLFGAIALSTLLYSGISEQVHAVGITLDQSADVGEFLNNAGVTNTQPFGTPLTSISGNLGGGDNIDFYQIYLPIGTFTASTLGGTNLDTQLFLFDSNGIGIIANNDNFPDFQSQISQSISTAGNYYLGVSLIGFNPQSASGPIFAIDPTTNGVQDPSIPGSGFGSSLNGWSSGFSPGQEGYSIAVSGAQFVGTNAAAVPFDFNPTFGVTILGIWVSWKYLKNRKKS